MTTAVELFRQLNEYPHTINVPFVILLNKSDLFPEALEKIDFTIYKPEMDVSLTRNMEYCIQTLKDDIIKVSKSNGISFYITNATDNKMIERVFKNITDSYRNMNLMGSDL